MEKIDAYQDYARRAVQEFGGRDEASRNLLVDAVRDLKIEKVLDVGCSAGQEMLPFIEKTDAFCVGVDIGEKLGVVGKELTKKANCERRVAFARSLGEQLPFAPESFDVVVCRVALPYMNNKRAIAEIARVLRPRGVFLLKIHAPAFYFEMIRQRSKSFSLRQIAYPVICLAGSAWHSLFGKQLQTGFWQGKEVFQTRAFLEREFAKNNLRIKGFLPDTNIETPSFIVEKI